jgi:hypothetical protein
VSSVVDWNAQAVADVNSSIPATDDVDDEVLYRGTGDQNLTAQNITAEVAFYADADDTTAETTSIGVQISSFTSDATRHVRLYTPVASAEVGTSQRHDGTSGSGYVFAPTVSSPTNFTILDISEPYIEVDGLSVSGENVTGASGQVRGVYLIGSSTSASYEVKNLVIQNIAGGTQGAGMYFFDFGGSETVLVSNTIIHAVAGGVAYGIDDDNGFDSIYVHNNTIFDIAASSTSAFGISANDIVAKNNYVGSITGSTPAAYSSTGFLAGSTHNVSFDATADDDSDMANAVINQSSYASYFNNITSGSEDFHLLNDSNALWGSYGADLDNDANLPITDDIDGDARDATQPDIGADEFTGTPGAPDITQIRYRWLYDNDDEDEADTRAAENTQIVNVVKSDIQRLRFQVSNEGTASSGSIEYRLEVSDWDDTCSTGTYERVSTDADWDLVDTREYSDGSASTDVSGVLTNENTTFVAGELKDTGDQTSAITLADTEFTELEFAIAPTKDAIDGSTYCFRLTNAGTALDTYTVYAEAIVNSPTTEIFRSVGNTTSNLEAVATTMSISGNTLTYSQDPTNGAGNHGVGDVVVYSDASVTYMAIITGRTNATTYTVTNGSGGRPRKVAPGTAVVGIYRAFTSLSNWESQSVANVNSSIPATNDVDDEVLYARTGEQDVASLNIQPSVALYADAADTSNVSIDVGWLTDTDAFLRIYTPTASGEVGTSQRHNGTAGTGYVLAPSGSIGLNFYDIFEIDTPYIRLDGIDISGENLTNGRSIRGLYPSSGTSGEVYIENTIIRDIANSTASDGVARTVVGIQMSNAGTSYVGNTMIYNLTGISENASSYPIAYTQNSSVTTYFYNNTVYDIVNSASAPTTAFGVVRSGGTLVAKNNYVGGVDVTSGSGDLDFDGTFTSSEYNVSSDATAPGTGSVTNQNSYASYFVDTTPGSIDLHLLNNSNALWGTFGADLDNDASYAITTDIDGDTRDATQPDIGADEQVGGSPDLTQTHYRWRNDDGGESGSGSWYNASWSNRVAVTIQASEVDSTLTDFPVYVDLSDLPAGFHSTVKSDGGDIRVTQSDGTTEVPREVVFYNSATDTGELHFKANSLSSTTNTTFYIYYGNASANDYATNATYGAENVWTEYVGVWHNQEDPSASSILDATGNNDGTPNANMTSGDSVSGFLSGQALDFDGDDYVDLSADGGVLDISGTGQTMTICAWAESNVTSPGSFPPIISKGDTQYVLKQHSSNGWEFKSGGVFILNSSVVADTWYYLCGVNTGSLNQMYIDSVLQGSTSAVSSIADQVHPVWMGRDSQNTGRSPYWQGTIDEVRISTSALSGDWIAAEYTNQSSPGTFYSVGSAESLSAGATWLAAEDAAYVLFTPGMIKRLRLQVSNEGAATASNTTYRLEVSGEDPGSCSSASYTRIDSSSTWNMATSTQIADGDPTSDISPGLTNENTTFVAGSYQESDDTSGGITLTDTEFTELEYVVTPTINAAGHSFCFRLTDAGSTLDTYSIYAEATVLANTLTFSVSDSTVGFGDVLPAASRFATGDTLGSATEAVAHTLSATTDAASGYSISASGPTLTVGGFTISAIGATPAAPNAGTEQFGLRLTASGGSGAVASPYNTSNYAYDAISSDTIATLGTGDGVQTIYSAYYLASIAALTEAGNYSTVIQYTITANF